MRRVLEFLGKASMLPDNSKLKHLLRHKQHRTEHAIRKMSIPSSFSPFCS